MAWVVGGVQKDRFETQATDRQLSRQAAQCSGALTSRGRSRLAIRFSRATEVNDSLMAIEGG